MTVLHESGIGFNFDGSVEKFDDLAEIKILSSACFNAVDFVSEHNGELVLLEIKNYAQVSQGSSKPERLEKGMKKVFLKFRQTYLYLLLKKNTKPTTLLALFIIPTNLLYFAPVMAERFKQYSKFESEVMQIQPRLFRDITEFNNIANQWGIQAQ